MPNLAKFGTSRIRVDPHAAGGLLTLLQIFCKFVPNSKVIDKIVLGPEDICPGNLHTYMA